MSAPVDTTRSFVVADPAPLVWDGAALDALAAAVPGAVTGRRALLGQHAALLAPEHLEAALRFLRDTPVWSFHLLADLAAWDRLEMLEEGAPSFDAGHEHRFEVVYHLYSIQRGARVRLVVPVDEDAPTIPTVTSLWPAANWHEREVWDQYGIAFDGHPNHKRILNHHQFVGHPLRRDYPIRRRVECDEPESLLDELDVPRPDEWKGFSLDARHLAKPRTDPDPAAHDSLDNLSVEHTVVNLGPSHPASHGTLRVLLKLDGERIERAVPEIGYLHRGFEKSAEAGTWTQVIPYTDRLNYNSALSNNVGYCKAIEAMLGIEVPERCQAIRVICMEMSRIMDHLICVGTNLVDIGALTNFWYFFNQRESFYKILEKLCGARLTTSYTRIGGLQCDAYDGFADEVLAVCQEVPRALADVRGLVERNRIFHERSEGIGAIGAAEAIAYGFTGPCLRASGVPFDLRRAHPYYGYDTYDFDIAVGEAGDARDRLLVRFEEIVQSVRILEQACRRLPGGEVTHPDWQVTLPPKDRVYGTIEGLMGHFNLIMHGIQVPAGECYDATEAPNGELGFYCVSDGGGKPHRVRVRPPCFPIYSAFARLIEGHLVADAIAVLGGLNVIAGELDR